MTIMITGIAGSLRRITLPQPTAQQNPARRAVIDGDSSRLPVREFLPGLAYQLAYQQRHAYIDPMRS
jgi:hypothetical protein